MNRLLVVLAALLISACSTTHVMVGNPRPPIAPELVKVYFTAPPKFEEIALVSSDSKGTMHITDQGKMDAVIVRLKEEAAKLGANGIILQNVGEKGAVTVGGANTQIYGRTATTTGFSVTQTGMIKTMSGLAVWVAP